MTIYTLPTCAPCGALKAFLDAKGIKYQTKDVQAPEARRELLERSKSMTVPVLEHNGKFVIGFNPARVMELLS